ncbi:hypothetical protein GCM10009624_24770 [Gordonia sinesedis]
MDPLDPFGTDPSAYPGDGDPSAPEAWHATAPDGTHDTEPAAALAADLGADLLPGEDEPVTGPDEHLWVHDDGRIWDLGPADVDTDADGIKDSLTRTGPDGMTVYTDTDHDGQVDRITEVGSDGSYSSRRLDPTSGQWVATDTGRLD